MMDNRQRSLLVRADFVLGESVPVERAVYRRWRRVLVNALPRLMGCAERCESAERVSLHATAEAGSFTGWVRIPIQRRPDRKQLRKLKRRFRDRLETSLAPAHGRVIKLGVRRCSGRPTEKADFLFSNAELVTSPEQRNLDFGLDNVLPQEAASFGGPILPLTCPPNG
jgi:hypothetical protein